MFSKLDLNQGYNQLELHEDSRCITTFATHVGLRRYNRLFFGINSAAEIFQEAIRNTLSDLKGVMNISDDILVYGENEEKHNDNLKAVLERLREKGLTLNRAKCELNKATVEYFGHVFSATGLSPNPKKIDAILQMQSPTTQSELRSFLGLTNYCGSRFVPNYATLTHELRQLTQKHIPWKWEQKHEEAIMKLKEALSKSVILNYYSMQRKTEVYVDASPVGLSAILMQYDDANDERDIIQFASRALTPTEAKYSQTEREALSVVFACEHFNMYVYGTSFTVITDHKPLTSIFGASATMKTLTPRIERWAMKLQPYDISMIYKPGVDNPADYLSRHPQKELSCDISRAEKVAEEYIAYIVDNTTPKAMSLDEIATETENDATLKTVKEALKTNRWYDARVKFNLLPNPLFKTLYNCRDELSVWNDKILMKGNKIIIPETLQMKVVELAHQGHQGIVKTVALLREKVWFKAMQSTAEATVRNCQLCQISTPQTSKEPLKMSKLPPAPWVEISADFGQVEDGLYIMVIQDEYSRYPIVEILKSTSSQTVIPILDKVFSEFGIPWQVKTDNGPPFNSHEFATYLKHMGVKHRKITPLWPQANAETERFMRTIKKIIRGKPKNWKQEMYKRLLAYRATPHSTTGIAPATVLFGRDVRTKLPSMIATTNSDSDMRQRDEANKEKMKRYADNKAYVKPSDFKVGDSVLVKNTSISKAQTPYDSIPLEIIAKKGSMVTAQRGESKITRNSSFFKRSIESPQEESYTKDTSDVITNDSIQDSNNPMEIQQATSATVPLCNKPVVHSPVRKPPHIAVTPPARPQRNRFPPRKYQDYVK